MYKMTGVTGVGHLPMCEKEFLFLIITSSVPFGRVDEILAAMSEKVFLATSITLTAT